MGTVLASAIISAAAGILQDEGFDRFTEAWLFSGINYGQREICFYKLDANVVGAAVKSAAAAAMRAAQQ